MPLFSCSPTIIYYLFATFKSSYNVTHKYVYPYHPLLISPATPPIIHHPVILRHPVLYRAHDRLETELCHDAGVAIIPQNHLHPLVGYRRISNIPGFLPKFWVCEIYVQYIYILNSIYIYIYQTDLLELIFTVQVPYRTGFAGKEHVHQQYHSSYGSSCLS